jgi:hypothetical protein
MQLWRSIFLTSTVTRRLICTPHDSKQQLRHVLEINAFFRLQLEEPRDVSYIPMLLVFIWMSSYKCNIMEERLITYHFIRRLEVKIYFTTFRIAF